MLPMPEAEVRPEVRWFSSQGCVVYQGDERRVYMGGGLVSTFSAAESGLRNVVVVQLSRDDKVHLGRLAEAFDVTEETLRLLRRLCEKQGMEALWKRHRGGREPKVTPRLRAKLDAMFEQGLGAREAQGRLRGKQKLGLRTVQRELSDWRSSKGEAASEANAAASSDDGVQQRLVLTDAANDTGQATVPAATAAAEEAGTIAEDATIAAAPVRPAAVVQHLGTWLMIAMVHRLGLHGRAVVAAEDRVRGEAVRIALDATVAALAIGQRCVEGARRLATRSAPALLRATRPPSASWVRRTLGLLSQWLGGLRLHAMMAAQYARAATAPPNKPMVFYIDNHLRPYTGQQVIRKGWRMQDKHVVAGVTDYWVHDVDGRPIARVAAPHHGSLTDFLTPIAQMLRQWVGEDCRILVAFDRAGSFPEQMAALRNEGFEFVTYERRQYPLLTATEFTDPVCLGDETVHVAEGSQRNLRGGRGRVRRIAIRKQDGEQINLLAISSESAAWLVGVMKGRWSQENAFKHGVERWGINQLDGRSVESYPPDTIIPNPARRRLDVALRAARSREGDALRELAHLTDTDDRARERFEREVAQARAEQAELEQLRPSVPTHAPVCETELADTLVRHRDEYKITLDTLRIACANAEADLAGEIAPHLTKPAEAKRIVANLLMAPGRVRTTDDRIYVTLSPAANGAEQDAIDQLLETVNGWRLTLPGDVRDRSLCFRAQF